MNEIIIAIDGDELAFVIASACEKRSIKATNILSETSSTFKHRTEMKAFLKGLEVPEGFYIVEDLQEADDIANALHTIKIKVNSYVEACKADKVEMYISGKDNFRNSIPLPTQYKSNRKDVIKPLLLQDIRNYLVNKYGAVVVDGREVDDVICQRMWDGYTTKQKIIGITQDKDAMGCSGWIFNPEKMTEPEFIQGLGELLIDDKNKVRGRGRKWFYTQWLMGDPTDCYNPSEICKARFGEKSAYKLLVDCATDLECVQAIYNQYKKWYPAEVAYNDFAGVQVETDVIGVMQMYIDCARMRRFEGDTLDVSSLLDKLGVIR